jgi:hypothetical protein
MQRRRPDPAPWWVWAAMAAGLLAAAPAWAQAPVVPEQVQPRAVPPGAGGNSGGTAPGLAPGEGAPGSGVPEGGVVTPPPLGSTGAVIRPPAVGTMPVIPPPGSPGGDRSVVPK